MVKSNAIEILASAQALRGQARRRGGGRSHIRSHEVVARSMATRAVAGCCEKGGMAKGFDGFRGGGRLRALELSGKFAPF